MVFGHSARASFAQNHHQHNDAPRDDRYGDHKQGSHALRLRPSRRAEYSECLALPRAPSGRTVGENDLPSARPIRNGLLIALKAVAPHAAPARSVTSASAASASAASAPRSLRRRCRRRASARPRPDAPPGPPRFTSTFACSPYDPHHQPDHSRDDRDDNNTHQDARHNTPPSQQVPPLSALLPGSFRAPTPIGTSSWVLFLVGYRSRRVLVSCSTPPQFAGQSVVPFCFYLCWASWCRPRPGSGSPTHRHTAPTGAISAQPSLGRPSSLSRAWRRAHYVQVPQVRDNGVRATTQPTARHSKGLRLCGSRARGTDAENAGVPPVNHTSAFWRTLTPWPPCSLATPRRSTGSTRFGVMDPLKRSAVCRRPERRRRRLGTRMQQKHTRPPTTSR